MQSLLRASRGLSRAAPRRAAVVGHRAVASQAFAKLTKVATEELKYEHEQYQSPPISQTYLKENSEWTLDNPAGTVTLTLSKEVDGKTIKVQWQLTEPTDMGEDEEEDVSTEFTVAISKATGQTLTFFCSTIPPEDGQRYMIGSVGCYRTKEEAANPMAYSGPEFEDLDEQVQESCDEFLGEHGVTPELCDFIEATATDKEQSEYIRWLEQVQSFTKA
mmetsp:Transcript_34282/g.74910  ORF Transcript_34282/g.74910 Transcript_34282/m.74910 type:complete len:218 (+) Transcript_34282:21-674(+)